MDITGFFHKTPLSGRRFAMLRVDDSVRFEIFSLLKDKRDATAALVHIINSHIFTQTSRSASSAQTGGALF